MVYVQLSPALRWYSPVFTPRISGKCLGYPRRSERASRFPEGNIVGEGYFNDPEKSLPNPFELKPNEFHTQVGRRNIARTGNPAAKYHVAYLLGIASLFRSNREELVGLANDD